MWKFWSTLFKNINKWYRKIASQVASYTISEFQETLFLDSKFLGINHKPSGFLYYNYSEKFFSLFKDLSEPSKRQSRREKKSSLPDFLFYFSKTKQNPRANCLIRKRNSRKVIASSVQYVSMLIRTYIHLSPYT